MLHKYFILFFMISASCFGKTTFVQNEQGELVVKNENQMQFNDFDQKFEKPEFHKAFIKMILSLIAIIVLCIISFWAFKKIVKTKTSSINNQKMINILEKKILSPKTMLYIIEYEGVKTIISESHLDIKMKTIKKNDLEKKDLS